MNIELRQLSFHDGIDVYQMLQEIPKDENGFINGGNGKTFDDYKQWLMKQDNMASGIDLEDWMVPSTTFWLFVDDLPVGFGKLRHYLTDKLKEDGGHAGYAIRPLYRNKGYGKLLLKILMEQANLMGIDKLLLTIQNDNERSIKVALANGGVIEKVTDIRHFIWIDCNAAR